MTNEQIQALFKLYPQVLTLTDNDARDAEGNPVVYDMTAVDAKVAQDEVDALAAEQAAAAHKESAVAKLSAIGLTEDEIKALIG